MSKDRTITMTEGELLAYTEQVVDKATKKTTPALVARRNALIEQMKLLFEDFNVKYEEGFERNYPFTDRERKVINTAKLDELTVLFGPMPTSITELRRMIKTAQQSLRAIERAHARHLRRWETARIKSKAATAKLQAVHDNHVCTRDCDDDLITIAGRRIADDAPPLTRSQIITIRRLLNRPSPAPTSPRRRS